MNTMNTWEAFYGPNAGYALELYERYLADPDAVDSTTRAFFEQTAPLDGGAAAIATLARPAADSQNGAGTRVSSSNGTGNGARTEALESVVASHPASPSREMVARIVVAARLARSIREYGHLAALIDPLGAARPGDPMLNPSTHGITDEDLAGLPASIVWPQAGPEAGSCLDAIHRLRGIYCGSTGYEFDHIQDFEERTWLHDVVEQGVCATSCSSEQRRALLARLTEVEGFERFLHTAFQGQKRFSIEGNDMLVPMLDEIIRDAAETGTRETLIGMAHRGRLNVMAHVLQKPYAAIFAKFQNATAKEQPAIDHAAALDQHWTGDVKYHLGARRTVHEGGHSDMAITLADNPSHLEFVNPVVEGFARAAQDKRGESGPPRQDVDAALPITIHGDAAFPGEGVVAETLNLSRLPGYTTGGTIRIIVNNQLGFTTLANDGRSTLYASDLAKGFEIPIVHVNADDPEACIAAVKLAHAYRLRFKRDVLIDLVGYRRWGHNEGDEPAFTQPQLYARIRSHPTARAVYAERLIQEDIISADQAAAMAEEILGRMRQARDEGSPPQPAPPAPSEQVEQPAALATAVSAEQLCALNEALLRRPDGFEGNKKLESLLGRRRDALNKPDGIDWTLAETLAFGSILADGTPIRLSGQDTERGTFSQRHLVLHDPETGAEYVPLQSLPQASASFAVYNSPLTESATIGFEYGYSVHAPDAMVLWEAQYGDFANAGQVLIDQFVVAARAKWQQGPALVLLLPHGYEGQGPEHSSARLERFLQLAAEDNLRVVNCTSAAQYFHLLRLQAATLAGDRRPLVIMTPKSLLRHPRAASSLGELTSGSFQPVLDDSDSLTRADAVERLVFCSGKVAIDLTTTATTHPDPVTWVAVARVEQLYPFPEGEICRAIAGYPNLSQIIWLQEEPSNMGAWSYMEPRLQHLLPVGVTLGYLGRPARASTAEGSPSVHAREQARILEAAFGGERRSKIETRGVHDAS